MEDEFDEELLELFELELFDELELLFELEFREEFDELLELRLELQLPPSSRLERAWLLPLPVAFCRKRVTGSSSATAGAGAAAPTTRNALRIARTFFITFLLCGDSLVDCKGGTSVEHAYSPGKRNFFNDIGGGCSAWKPRRRCGMRRR
ncbi:hypothetical protein LAC81_27760 [Ensifer adhaerens]|uniref:hypothetical protein n=1 Tax=Ensifer adhaerens TaxID=106592 RepID=UPI001CBE7580|nr:hypothetical protein [Ensifer adhaerens]MBZ7924531.1 hypothetical protein [Ensifer adhaerens]UAX96230.1 hypothetical protein LAC78_20720 [Ensifer adhaerens]UAY04427.1 hypothetical protein LAC80_24240 [Ensifer adhaerens]UAY09859.1 hypothetical protein LAC81_27760 [Ensifer adhaerens]